MLSWLVEPDSTARFKQRALVEMKESAMALVRNNQNELLAARTLYVSLDRTDNVIEGGPPARVQPNRRFFRGSIAESTQWRVLH